MVDSSALWSQLTCSSICQVTHDAAIRLALDGCGGWIAHEMMECLAPKGQLLSYGSATSLGTKGGFKAPEPYEVANKCCCLCWE